MRRMTLLVLVGLTAVLVGPVSGATAVAAAPSTTAATSVTASGGDLDSVGDVLAPVAGGVTALPPKPWVSTASGLGVRKGLLPAGSSLAVDVTGVNGVPEADVASVRLSVTSTSSTAAGAITVHPDGAARPSTPSLRFPAGRTTTTEIVVGVPASGRLRIHTTATTHVQVATLGWARTGTPSAAGSFRTVTPATLASTVSGTGVRKGLLGAGSSLSLSALGRAGVPATGVGSVTVSVTSSGSTASGALTLYAAGTTRPSVPSVRFTKGVAATAQVTVRVPADGRLTVHTTATTHVTLTVVGYSLDGLTSAARTVTVLDPRAVVSTSSGLGARRGAIPAAGTLTVPLTGRGGVPSGGVGAVLLVVTSSGSTASGSLTLYPAGSSRPTTPTLRFAAGATTSGQAFVRLPADGRVTIHASATTQVRLDVVGHVLSVDRSTVRAVPRATTLSPAAAQIVSVTGPTAGQQVVVLTRTGRRPAPGDPLVAPVSATAPDGLLATVVDVQDTDGSWTVTTAPASLSDAYSTYEVASRSAVAGTVSPAVAPSPARTPAATSAIGGFECTGSDGAVTPQVSVSIDPGRIRTDFTLEANVFAPYLNMSVGVAPTVTVSAALTASVVCERRFPILARVPVSVGPPLEIVIRPVVVISATGEISTTLTWRSRAFVSVLATKQGADFSQGFGSSLDADTDGSAVLTASAAVRATLTIAGVEEIEDAGGDVPRVAVDATLGPELGLAYKGKPGCFEATAYAHLTLSASADLLVDEWTFDALDKTTDPKVLWTTCKPWTGVITLTGGDAFVWQKEGGAYGQSESIDLESHYLVDPEDLAHPTATSRGTASARSFGGGTCYRTTFDSGGTVPSAYVDPVYNDDGTTADGFSLPTAVGTVTGYAECATVDTVDPDGQLSRGVGTTAFELYVTNRLNGMLQAGGGHRIDATVTASIEQVCAETWYGCDFQKPNPEEKSGGWTMRIRITDRPDADSDGIPDATDTTPTSPDAVS